MHAQKPPSRSPAPAMTQVLRAALYLRVSTGRQAEHDLSIPDQRAQTIGWLRRAAGRLSPRSMSSQAHRPRMISVPSSNG